MGMEAILKKIYGSEKISLTLKIISHASVALTVAVFLSVTYLSYISGVTEAIKLFVCALVPFAIVTVTRRLINAQRPYELYGFYTVPPKKKKGCSFPSRHVFSAFCIATLALPYSVLLGVSVYCAGVVLSVSRVLLGFHFIRDAVCGAAIGIISGIMGILIIL